MIVVVVVVAAAAAAAAADILSVSNWPKHALCFVLGFFN